MDWLKLPPLSGLRAFSALAETKSLTAAGQALNVSHAAISQQIKALETRLGVKLIERRGRGIELTPEGQTLGMELRSGFGIISEAVQRLAANDESRPLQITTTPIFAVNWLMPRLSEFSHAHPEIELMVNPTPELADFTAGGLDLAIRFGDGSWPGLHSERLLDTDFVVVAASSLLEGRKVTTPRDLLDLTWLQELGTNEIAKWLEGQGVLGGKPRSVLQLPGYMVLNSLKNGDGIAATARSFVEEEINDGRMRILFSNSKSDSGYHIVTRPGVMRPPLKTFVQWLRRHRDEA